MMARQPDVPNLICVVMLCLGEKTAFSCLLLALGSLDESGFRRDLNPE
jgi:hypothetical protein